ncbi:DUF5666 domain-containing protein [Nocardia sp. GAS34]|uniref:DUF5666 domain-containing protein n=1 Tax=unclassified Nocardia TaxID=2637762 RepID=UPI003D23BB19
MTHPTPSGSPSTSSRRRRIALVTGATGAAVAIVVGVSACGSSGNTSSAPASSTSASASSTAKPGKHRGNAIFGTIASQNADTWTLTKKDGTTETVTITPQTKFGSKKNPAQQSQFTLGEMVAVRGKESGTTITATDITQAKQHSASATPSASAAPAAPTTN